MHDGGLVYAVPLLIVDLIAIDEGGRGRRNPTAGAPDARGIAAAPFGCDRLEFAHHGNPRARERDSEGIEDEGFRRFDRRLRKVFVTPVRHVFHEAVGDVRGRGF